MKALDLLVNRRSASKLTGPSPQGEQRQSILQAGMRVPDHGGLRPWRFFLIEESGQQRLSTVLAQAAQAMGWTEKQQQKARQMPFRAPLIIAVVAHCETHEKVPRIEQIMSAGCAVMAMQLAALAQGFNGIWRTGALLESPLVRKAFGCREQDQIVGFLYLGTPQSAMTATPAATLTTTNTSKTTTTTKTTTTIPTSSTTSDTTLSSDSTMAISACADSATIVQYF